MDTNSLSMLISALTQSKAPLPSSNLVLILVTLNPLIAGLIAWFAKQTASSVEKIHVAVNSERTAALEEIKSLRLEVKSLSERIAFDAGKETETPKPHHDRNKGRGRS